MLLRLADGLDLPLRERNVLLLVGGHAPEYPETAPSDAVLRPVLEVLERVLDGHLPAPAVLVDADGRIVSANAAFDVLSEGAAAHLLEPPINVLRLALHPDGMSPRSRNLPDWGRHVIDGIRARANGAESRVALAAELEAYLPRGGAEPAGFAVPLQLGCADGELELVTTLTTFATARDITLSELVLEAFLPVDRATAGILEQRASKRRGTKRTT